MNRHACPCLLACVLATGAVACVDGPQRRHGPDMGATIDPVRMAAGDVIGGLRIGSLEMQRSMAPPGGWIGRATFEGELAVSGAFRPHFNHPELPLQCFFPDAPGGRQLPRLAEDERIPWFCFSNQDLAAHLLAPPPGTGTARIVVDRFQYEYAHTDVYNQARLVSVQSAARDGVPTR